MPAAKQSRAGPGGGGNVPPVPGAADRDRATASNSDPRPPRRYLYAQLQTFDGTSARRMANVARHQADADVSSLVRAPKLYGGSASGSVERSEKSFDRAGNADPEQGH